MRTKLKILRIKHQLTQDEIAARLGYKRAYFGHVESGHTGGSQEFWQRLQNAFQLTDDEVQELKAID